jgi:hypothetical protein
MVALILEKFQKKLLVVGPIYDKIKILQSQQELWDQQELVIFNGNLCYPNDNLDQVEARIEMMEKLLQSGKFIYNVGHQDLLLMKQLEQNNQYSEIVAWIKNKYNVIQINFLNQYNLIITNGGLTSEMKKSDLQNNLETSFVSNIDGQPWHHWYGGKYGYVISNHPLTQEPPRFYNFSLQMGNTYHDKNLTYATQIGQYGVEYIFSLQDTNKSISFKNLSLLRMSEF